MHMCTCLLYDPMSPVQGPHPTPFWEVAVPHEGRGSISSRLLTIDFCAYGDRIKLRFKARNKDPFTKCWLFL